MATTDLPGGLAKPAQRAMARPAMVRLAVVERVATYDDAVWEMGLDAAPGLVRTELVTFAEGQRAAREPLDGTQGRRAAADAAQPVSAEVAS